MAEIRIDLRLNKTASTITLKDEVIMVFIFPLACQEHLRWSPMARALVHDLRLPEEVHPLRQITGKGEVIVAHTASGDHTWIDDSDLNEQVSTEAAREIIDLWDAA
jgi:hypothetical protein